MALFGFGKKRKTKRKYLLTLAVVIALQMKQITQHPGIVPIRKKVKSTVSKC